MTDKEIKNYINATDANKDGYLSYKEVIDEYN
jgi:Ca2+-binding EF-hand superfamily protein